MKFHSVFYLLSLSASIMYCFNPAWLGFVITFSAMLICMEERP